MRTSPQTFGFPPSKAFLQKERAMAIQSLLSSKYSRIATSNLVLHFVFRTHIVSLERPPAFVINREVFGALESC